LLKLINVVLEDSDVVKLFKVLTTLENLENSEFFNAGKLREF